MGFSSSIAIAAMTVGNVEAFLLRGSPSGFPSPLLSQRTVVNLNPVADFNYAFINHMNSADSMVSPVGTAFSATTHTFTQLIDQNGWPNAAEASGSNFGGGFRIPRTSDFAGPYVLDFDGDGRLSLQASGTWTEASTTSNAVGNANGTTTLSGFSTVVGIAPGFGITGTGVPGSTTVVSVNYAAKTIVVSAAVTTGSGVTFTFTNGTYTKNSNGTWTAVPGKRAYVVASNSGYSNPALISFQVQSTGGTPVSVSSMSWSGGLVTVTTAAPHGRPLGYALSLTFFGATPGTINSTFLCTVTGSSTYTFSLTGNPGSITGTLTYIAFLTNARFYRQEDEVDLAPASVGGNGLIFRAKYKQNYVNLQPAAIRFVNWVDAVASRLYRFENRSIPTKAGAKVNATAGPAYGDTVGVNQYTLAAATGTAGNSQTTTASMVHGEVACCRLGVGGTGVRASSAPTAITRAAVGVVTTASPHGYSNGDLVIFNSCVDGSNTFQGMVELNYVVLTVANATATTFETNDINNVPINTSTFTAFLAAGAKANAIIYPYISLQVGSGNDRVPYAVNLAAAARGPAASGGTGSAVFTAANTYTFYFDKNIAGRRTHGTGANWVQGTWLESGGSTAGSPSFPTGDVPLEYCAAFVAETNILAKAQGFNNPIHMWLCTPPRALLFGDPDYSSASDWPVNAIATVFNGGYGCTGLSATNASLIFEWSNEPWNLASENGNYFNWLSYLRGSANIVSFPPLQALRAAMCARDVSANSAFASRVYQTIGLQASSAWAAQNQQVALGTGIYFTDPWNTWGSATPLSFVNAVNPATYLDPGANAYANPTSGTGTLTDDSALYNGTDNSGTLSMTGGTGGVPSTTLTITAVGAGTPVVNQPLVGTGITSPATYITAVSGVSPNYTITLNQNATVANGATITAPANGGGNYIGAANQTQAIVNFVAAVVGPSTGSQTVSAFCSAGSPNAGLIGQIATGIGLTKTVIGYEGSTDWGIGVGGGVQNHTVTGPDNLFVKAVNVSTQFATALMGLFSNLTQITNAGPQAIYLTQSQNGSTSDLRWAYFGADTYSGGVEGAAFLNAATLSALITRNQALSP